MIKKVLVTGDKGYIGTLLTKFLKNLNYHVEELILVTLKTVFLGKITEDYKSIKKDIRT